MHIQGGASAASGGCCSQRPDANQSIETQRRRDHPRSQQKDPVRQPSRDIAVGASVDTRSRLVLRTADGDSVTISLEAHSKLAAASHSGAEGSALAIEQSSSYKASINVKGELSDAEVEDISKLLQVLAAASSGTQAPDAGSLDTADLDTIAGFQYRQQQSVRAGAYFSLAA